MSDSAFRKLTGPLRRRVKLLISRAVGRLVDPDTLLQTLQLEVLKGEVLDGVEHMEGYGRTANPPDGFEALTASLGGDRSHTVCISAFHRQFRLTGLAGGEVALYDDQGQAIHLKRDKTIHIYGCDTLTADIGVQATITCPLVTLAASTKVRMETPLLEVTGEIMDNCGTNTNAMSDMRQIYDTHDHPGDSGGTTGAPNQQM